MTQPLPPTPPAQNLKLKVPGAPVVGASSGGPKLKVTTSPFAGPGSPPPAPVPPPNPVPAAPTPPPNPVPTAPTPPSPTPPPLVTQSPVSATTETAPIPADESAVTSDPPKSKKKSKKTNNSDSSGSKSKPSILFLVLDFLVFGGAIALSVLIFLKS